MFNFLDEPDDSDATTNSRDNFSEGEEIQLEELSTRDEIEDAILTTALIDQALERLPAPFHCMMELLYAYRASPGYSGVWPPTAHDVGRYLGQRFYDGHSVPARTIWRWHRAVLARWRRLSIDGDSASAVARAAPSTLTRTTLSRAA